MLATPKGRDGIASLSISLIEFAGYTLSVAGFFWITALWRGMNAPPSDMATSDIIGTVAFAALAGLAIAVTSGIICLFFVSYLLLPFITRVLFRNDRIALPATFVLIETHYVVALCWMAQDFGWQISLPLALATLMNSVLLYLFLRRPHLHRTY
ncbi:hypothetical protein SAMN06273572_105115 [Monaibacterium marinum]|uniref:Uncharacterized protein n=1 Tax=Pontivivens marinum TaxID=1690039 RepID=A0A2C9CTU8_9RHOB|nr:hypothetical protein [Monaibacterium marinum]SOH94692.1 hypothetical protein SAMN06273572_105115 [Monaibacterium marinum]